jgi:hypothetical protein
MKAKHLIVAASVFVAATAAFAGDVDPFTNQFTSAQEQSIAPDAVFTGAQMAQSGTSGNLGSSVASDPEGVRNESIADTASIRSRDEVRAEAVQATQDKFHGVNSSDDIWRF